MFGWTFKRFFVFLVIWLGIVSAGCGVAVHPLSGSSAMRIEVEVYKGPLSEEPEVQWQGVLGFLDEVEHGLTALDDLTRAIYANQFYSGDIVHGDLTEEKSTVEKASKPQFTWPIRRRLKDPHETNWLLDQTLQETCQKQEPFWPWSGWGTEDHWDCHWLSTLLLGTDHILQKVAALRSSTPHCESHPHSGCTRSYLQKVVRLATEMRGQATRWAVATTPGPSPDYKVRIAVVNIIVAMAEYGNQLKARADALLKQVDRSQDEQTGVDRRELPPSVFFRASEPTEFSHLYEWLDASAPAYVTEDFWQWPFYILGKVNPLYSPESVIDRTKMVDRLFADLHWAKINTVYASGRGEVNMALIKDDVGNWNLKSFDNDPADLLQAYNDLSITALKKASKIITNGLTGGLSDAVMKAVEGLKTFAQQSWLGGSSTTASVSFLKTQFEELQSKNHLKWQEESTKVSATTKLTQDSLESLERILSEHIESLDTMASSLVTQ